MLLLYRQTHSNGSCALILTGDSHTLSFRRPAASTSTAGPQIELTLDPLGEFDVGSCTLLGRVHAALGVVYLHNDIFLCVVSGATSLTSRNTPGEQVSRIQGCDFYSVTSAAWDDYKHHDPAASAGTHHGSQSSGTANAVPQTYGGAGNGMGRSLGLGGAYSDTLSVPHSSSGTTSPQFYEHPANAMHKILSNGHFYYSSGNYDITTRLEERMRRRDDGDNETAYDSRFVWNSFLIDSLLDFRENLNYSEKQAFDDAGFVVSAIQGFVSVSDFTLSGNPVTLTLISRLGSARAGTRFNARGIDDDGNVANFVETETIFRTRDSCFSFVQVRGSVPLFWEQQAGNPFGGQKVQITRPPVASQPAFNKHFTALLAAYQRVHAVNLLSTKDHEALLTNTYKEHVKNLNAQLGDAYGEMFNAAGAEEVGFAVFDYHAEARKVTGYEGIRDLIRRAPQVGGLIDGLGYCLVTIDEKQADNVVTRQEGVYRTNCLDCLDRTNVVQDILSHMAIEHYLLNAIPSWAGSDIILSAHRTLWAENGDALSKIYAGTGALNTSFTRSGKRTLAGVVADATKSATRLYVANFLDKNKQLAIDALLGNMTNQQKVVVVDPVRDSVDSALRHRAPEYSSQAEYSIMCGTFNVNGKVPGDESILPWLFPKSSHEPDIIALGFQELVELSPQQIMATDPEKLRRWQIILADAMAHRQKASTEYVVLRAEQLVGTALIIFVSTTVVPHIRNVEITTKKTGLKGMAGNKGAVAVRMDLDESSFCFITAHFAAGHSNVEQRNMDYGTIAHGLQFRRGRKVSSHQNVLFCGDLNYRMAMPNEHVRDLATSDRFPELIEADQLTSSIKQQIVFAGYSEGPLVFRPTYKYDNNSDVYDTSEKQRIPSWTDRILYKGAGLSLQEYNRAELRLSDHRPVYAIFKAKVDVIDRAKKDKIAREIFLTLSPNKAKAEVVATKLLINGLDNDAPLPSTETSNWWHDADLGSLVQQAKATPNTARRRQDSVSSAMSGLQVKDLMSEEPENLGDLALLAATPPTSGLFAPVVASIDRASSVKRKPVPQIPGNKPNGGSSPASNGQGPVQPEAEVGALVQSPPEIIQRASESEIRTAVSDNIFLKSDRARTVSTGSNSDWQLVNRVK